VPFSFCIERDFACQRGVVIIINKNMPKRKIPSLSIEEEGKRFYGVKKQKGFSYSYSAGIDDDWTLPEYVGTPIVEFLQLMNNAEGHSENINLSIIEKEVARNQSNKRAMDSDSLLGSSEINFPQKTERCKSAKTCLLEVLKAELTAKNAIDVLGELPPILQALIPNEKNDSI
jgi:hypothetical protein